VETEANRVIEPAETNQFDLDIKTSVRGGWFSWLGPLGATALAALIRLPNLGRPHELVFDETYYAKDALSLLNFGVERKFVEGANEKLLATDGTNYLSIFTADPAYVVHPPIGKWVIASGEAIFGATPFGWRIAVALLGILSVLLTARIARRLTNSNFIGTVAGLLLALDGLHITMSRTALLDTTLSFFVLCAFGALIIDRDRLSNSAFRIWRWVMVVALGLAISTKWSALYYAVTFGGLMLFWDFARRKRDGDLEHWTSKDLLPALAMPFLAIGIYLASWVGWFRSENGWGRTWGLTNNNSFLPDAFASLINYHRDMWHFHTTLVTPHGYQANPWGWPLMLRPTSFFYESENTCAAARCSQEVIPLGNPLIWWVGVLALILLLALAVNKRFSAALPIVAAFLAGWLPWLFFTKRTVFNFYSVVYLPYTVMALAILLYLINKKIKSTKPISKRWPAIVFLICVAALTAFFYPILVGQSIPYDMWHMRMWLPTWI
jgi:dolichyl-phosphate-mannose--protein O-mannosyl transferase